MHEFRLIHPEYDLTLAIELKGEPFFPIQDTRSNICALQKKDGTLAQGPVIQPLDPKQLKETIAYPIPGALPIDVKLPIFPFLLIVFTILN